MRPVRLLKEKSGEVVAAGLYKDGLVSTIPTTIL